jgi:L-lactate dehydrogenase (cytochrome)
VRDLIRRAKTAGCSALMLTLDLQIIGQRHKDLKNGMTVPPKITAGNVLDMMTKVPWGLRMLGAKRKVFGNLAGHVKGADGIVSLSQWTASQFDPSLNWGDVAWIKEEWGGKLIMKGIQDPEDAKQAVKAGADAIIVSNHGGRQLDGAISSIAALPAVVEAVGRDIEIWMDGGVRSGQDVFKALALGAKGVLIGRAFNFGLGAMGEAGVAKALDIIQKELLVTMGLCGVNSISEINPTQLQPGSFAHTTFAAK